MHVAGGCFCGQVRYVFDGTPLSQGLCHCPDCKKVTGSAFAAYFTVHRDDLRMTGSLARTFGTSGRGTETQRNFCPSCGTTVFGGGPGGEAINLYAGTFDDPALFAPETAIYVDARVAWAHLAPGTVPERDRLPDHAGPARVGAVRTEQS